MNKQEISKRVLQNGKPLSLDKFTWDNKTRTFSSKEKSLMIDFKGIDNCTFNTGSDCTFNTYSYCTFNTGSVCTFNTGSYCTFKTYSDCTFKTGLGCTFDIWMIGYIHNNTQNNVVIIRNLMTKTIYDLDTQPEQFLRLSINDIKVIECL